MLADWISAGLDYSYINYVIPLLGSTNCENSIIATKVVSTLSSFYAITQLMTKSCNFLRNQSPSSYENTQLFFATTQLLSQLRNVLRNISWYFLRNHWCSVTNESLENTKLTPPPPTNPPPTYTCTTTGPSPPPITSQPLTPHYHHSPTPPLTKIYSNFYCPLDLDNINTSLVL